MIALLGGLRLYHSRPDTSPTLGLRVERTLLGIEVKWNPATPEMATAKDADLVIWDGSSPPAFVRLAPAQLLAGRTFVASANDRVEVRLDIIGTAGRARTESIVSVVHAPDLGPSSPLPTGITQQPQEEAKASPPAAPVPPPALVKPATSVAPVPKADNQPAEFSKPPERPATTANSTAVPIRETRPEIPSDLRTLIQSDNVVDVQVSISASGKVTGAKLGTLRGPVADALGKTAVNAALGWQFRPATQNGEAVPSDKILEFLFRPSTR